MYIKTNIHNHRYCDWRTKFANFYLKFKHDEFGNPARGEKKEYEMF